MISFFRSTLFSRFSQSLKVFSGGTSPLSTAQKSGSEIMKEILRNKFPSAENIEVVDISGGCGAMYEVHVESDEFKGMAIIKQHRLINEVLKEHIKQMHGLRIHTSTPKPPSSS